MIVIVGHGSSARKVDGSWLDKQTVVRLKHPKIFPGTRTDYYCSRSLSLRPNNTTPFWLFPRKGEPASAYGGKSLVGVSLADTEKWYTYWEQFADKPSRKPSTGLCAIFCAVEFLNPSEIGLTGFDYFLAGAGAWKVHDMRAEKECALSLGVELIDLGRDI